MSYPDYRDRWEHLQTIIADCHKNSKAKGWWPEETYEARLPTIPTKLMLVVSELAEALEEYRDGRMTPTFASPDGERMNIHGQLNKPIGFPSEMADAVIRLFDQACALDIDLAEAIRLKMAYNVTREYRHGGKAV